MKTLLLLLLTIPTLAQSTLSSNDWELVKRHYYIDKQKDQQIADLKEARDSLFEITVRMDERLQNVAVMNDNAIKNIVELKDQECKLKMDKPTPWYKHPLFYGGLGFIGGVYLAKN